jgi:hypothetical protein
MESLFRGLSIPTECLTQNTLDQSRIANQDPPQTKTINQIFNPFANVPTLSVSELAFSQTFFKGIFTLFTTPLDPSNIAMLDHSSGTR